MGIVEEKFHRFQEYSELIEVHKMKECKIKSEQTFDLIRLLYC